MVIVPSIPFRRRRGRLMRTGPLALLAVGSVSFTGTSGTLTATFDVNPGFALTNVASAEPSKWQARFGGVRYVAISITPVSSNQIQVNFTDLNPEAGANVLNYSNAPSDIADTQGRQLAAFNGFAL